MKLQYIHKGLQFFFVTAALAGRPEVLSQLVEGEKRPKLTKLGELVKAILLALHEVFPAVRLSDYVIMPDRVRMMPCSLPPSYDPSAEDSRELAADRLLILSGFTETPAVPARDIRRVLGASHQFRQNCLKMNDLAAALCATAQGKDLATKETT